MSKLFRKIRLLVACVVFSLLVHTLPVIALRMFSSFNFGAPVNQPPAVMVSLVERATPVAAAVNAEVPLHRAISQAQQAVTVDRNTLRAPEMPGCIPAARKEPAAKPLPSNPVTAAKEDPAPAPKPTPPEGSPQLTAAFAQSHGLKSCDFMAVQHEKLTYQISMHGIPIGSAELEAKNEQGVTTITLRVRSNAAISSIFPVDDVVETRHIDGRFIMTKIQQQEGSFRSNEAFTINLGKKRVFWDDFIQHRSLRMTVPTDEVLDTLSGIYYLRNRQLQVGKTEILHIFDSESYAEVPVEVLRREEMRLPNLARVATLVVRPLQKTAGIFRRTGAVLIWMTDDGHKVPVKIVTSIALGQVTAELISAESEGPGDGKVPAGPVASFVPLP
jgi:hypothetical protein